MVFAKLQALDTFTNHTLASLFFSRTQAICQSWTDLYPKTFFGYPQSLFPFFSSPYHPIQTLFQRTRPRRFPASFLLDCWSNCNQRHKEVFSFFLLPVSPIPTAKHETANRKTPFQDGIVNLRIYLDKYPVSTYLWGRSYITGHFLKGLPPLAYESSCLSLCCIAKVTISQASHAFTTEF